MGNTLQKQETMGNIMQKQEESTFFICQICFEPMLSSTKKFNSNNRCVHPFCTDCMIKYIEVKVNNDVADIKCPGLNCEQRLDPLTCRPIMPAKLFDQWCDVLCESAVLRFERCYCPYWFCSALIVNECGGNVKKSKCPNCKRRFCFRCKLPWYPGHRCEESGVKIDINNDIQFGVLVEMEKWKRCPHCDRCIERIGGCHDIICRRSYGKE
ncbi:E3 ubiquitin-protein ligase RSL1-like [Cornus florida]|uniref:E3 ubiquitin-protein ligase RSL1-like n=1 Tax=Cornus florida TaxID=4283 RepID=UPI002897143B|nr:E3 ubiquitin-protein ligase RSL1-like [Cornus florida]